MTKKGADPPPKLEAYEIIGAPQVSSISRKTDSSAGAGMKRWDERDAMKDANSVLPGLVNIQKAIEHGHL